MTSISRRNFLTSGILSTLGIFTGFTGIKEGKGSESVSSERKIRNNPLDGITREKIRITDIIDSE
jgi:hypothetical protein